MQPHLSYVHTFWYSNYTFIVWSNTYFPNFPTSATHVARILISDEDCGWYAILICPHSTIYLIHWKKEGSYGEPSLSAATWAFALLLSIHISSNSSQPLFFISSCRIKWQHHRVQHRQCSEVRRWSVLSTDKSSGNSRCWALTNLTRLRENEIFESLVIWNIGNIYHTSTTFQDLAQKHKDVSTFFYNLGKTMHLTLNLILRSSKNCLATVSSKILSNKYVWHENCQPRWVTLVKLLNTESKVFQHKAPGIAINTIFNSTEQEIVAYA